MNTTSYRISRSQFRTARSLPQPTSGGFTLVEMLVALAVAAVLLAVAIPSFAAISRFTTLSSASNVFLSGLYLARNEAIKRNSRVVLCKSADGNMCTASGGWEQGWIVFHDANNNGTREDAEAIIRREATLTTSLRLTGNMHVARYVSFAPTGGTRLLGGGFQAGTLTLCHQSAEGAEAREIILNAAGRPRVQKTRVAHCA